MLLLILYFSKYSWALFRDTVNSLEKSLLFCASILRRTGTVLSLWLSTLCHWSWPFCVPCPRRLSELALCGTQEHRIFQSFLFFLNPPPCTFLTRTAWTVISRNTPYTPSADLDLSVRAFHSCQSSWDSSCPALMSPSVSTPPVCSSSASSLCPVLLPDSCLSEIALFASYPRS